MEIFLKSGIWLSEHIWEVAGGLIAGYILLAVLTVVVA